MSKESKDDSEKPRPDEIPTATDAKLAERLLQAFPRETAEDEPKTLFDPDLPRRLQALQKAKPKVSRPPVDPKLLDELAPKTPAAAKPRPNTKVKKPQKSLTATVLGDVKDAELLKKTHDAGVGHFDMPPEADGAQTRFQKALVAGQKQLQTMPKVVRALAAALCFVFAVGLGWILHSPAAPIKDKPVLDSKADAPLAHQQASTTLAQPKSLAVARLPSQTPASTSLAPAAHIDKTTQAKDDARDALQDTVLNTEKQAAEALMAGQMTEALVHYQRLSKLLNNDRIIATFVHILKKQNNTRCMDSATGGAGCDF